MRIPNPHRETQVLPPLPSNALSSPESSCPSVPIVSKPLRTACIHIPSAPTDDLDPSLSSVAFGQCTQAGQLLLTQRTEDNESSWPISGPLAFQVYGEGTGSQYVARQGLQHDAGLEGL